MSDAALIIGGSILQVPAIREVQALGLKAIITDGNRNAPGMALADACWEISTYDVDGHRQLAHELAESYTLRGVFTAGADVAPTVAAVAEELGLPGIPFDVACRTHHKISVRQSLTLMGLQRYQPRYAWDLYLETDRFCSVKDMIQRYIQRHGGAVVKPPDQRASRGISLVRNAGEITAALENARPWVKSCILVEELLTGTEHSAEIILRDGTSLYFNMVDRMFRYDGGIPIETGHVNPSRHMKTPRGLQVLDILQEAAKALGVTWGPFKADLMLTDNGWKILECTARLSGGFDSTHTTPLGQGRHPVRLLAKLACGMDMTPEDVATPMPRYAACAAAFPEPGRVVDVPVIWRGERAPQEFYVTVKPGDVIMPYKHNAQRPGFCLAVAKSYDKAWALASEAAEVLVLAIVTAAI